MQSISVEEIFCEARITGFRSVPWKEQIPETGPGVYVISIKDPSSVNSKDIKKSERARWFPEEEIIYIGRAVSVSRRLKKFYRHRYDDISAYQRGQAFLMLEPHMMTVHYAAVVDYIAAEGRLIRAFETHVGRKPFGNRIRSAQAITFEPWATTSRNQA